MRDWLGELENRFCIAMVFSAAAVAGAIVTVLGSGSENLVQSGAIEWIPLVFPLWVLLISLHILNFAPI